VNGEINFVPEHHPNLFYRRRGMPIPDLELPNADIFLFTAFPIKVLVGNL
jgi:hypothetical protein